MGRWSSSIPIGDAVHLDWEEGCCTHHRTVPQFPLLTHTLCKTSSVSHLSGEDPLQSTLSGIYYYFFSPKKIKYFLFISTFGCKVF